MDLKKLLDGNITRVDVQGVWNDSVKTFSEWYEDVINTMWIEDYITDSRYDELLEVDDIAEQYEAVREYAEVWSFDFINENGENIFK